MIKHTIYGRVPSKKNSKQICRGRLISSAKYLEWEAVQLSILDIPPIVTPCTLTATFYAPDKRLFDLSNKVESVQDLFVKAGIIPDDNYTHLPQVTLIFGGVDKANPRVELEFSQND